MNIFLYKFKKFDIQSTKYLNSYQNKGKNNVAATRLKMIDNEKLYTSKLWRYGNIELVRKFTYCGCFTDAIIGSNMKAITYWLFRNGTKSINSHFSDLLKCENIRLMKYLMSYTSAYVTDSGVLNSSLILIKKFAYKRLDHIANYMSQGTIRSVFRNGSISIIKKYLSIINYEYDLSDALVYEVDLRLVKYVLENKVILKYSVVRPDLRPYLYKYLEVKLK